MTRPETFSEPICGTCHKPERLRPHPDAHQLVALGLEDAPWLPCPDCGIPRDEGYSLSHDLSRHAAWPPDPEILHVVAFDDGGVTAEDHVFTLSWAPNVCGWETDASCPGYGLPLGVARAIANAYNERIR